MENLKVETLKYQSVYESPEWQTIHPIDRAQLLLVAEGVKRGTIIGGDRYIFPHIIANLGLNAKLNTDINNPKAVYKAVYVVARPDILRAYLTAGNDLPENTSMAVKHSIIGQFLGYPDCCIQEYSHPTVIGREPRFIQELEVHMAQNNGKYPAEFDFLPPSFTPCSATCCNALATLNIWMRKIQAADPEAAQQLAQFNKVDFQINDPNIRFEPLVQPRILKIARKIWRTLSLK